MKILVIQLRRIGDILLTTPVLSYLKKAMPAADLHFLCEPAGRSVLETHPLISKLIIYDKTKRIDEIRRVRAERYDVIFDFMNNPTSAILTFLSGATCTVGFAKGLRSHLYKMRMPVPTEPEYVSSRKIRLVQYWLQQAGLNPPAPDTERPQVFLRPEDEQFADDWVKREGIGETGFAIFAPVSRYPIRMWRRDGFREVARKLTAEGLRIYLAWGPGEEKLVDSMREGREDQIRVLPLTSMREMAALIKRSKFVLSASTGAMHVAVAVGTPTVTIYGPNRPVDWDPPMKGSFKNVSLTAPGVTCIGCHLNDGCPVGHICMTKLSDDQVLSACRQILK